MKFLSPVPSRWVGWAVALWFGNVGALAAPAEMSTNKWKWELMDNGPFFTSNLELGKDRTALKVVTVRLTDGPDREAAAMAFDTMTLRWVAGWTGGLLHLPKGRDGLEGVPKPWSSPAWTTPFGPGWSHGAEWKDPRATVNERLPDAWGKWHGLHLQGDTVVLDYSVGGVGVLERAGFRRVNGRAIFSREFQFDRAVRGQSVVIGALDGGQLEIRGAMAVLRNGAANQTFAAQVSGAGKYEWSQGANGSLVLGLTSVPKNRAVRVEMWSGDASPQVASDLPAAPVSKDLRPLLSPKGGRWGAPLVTQGRLATSGGDGAYVVDTLTPPEPNPYQSWLRFSGFDFFKDPTRAAICSVSGDVWLVSGIDASLGRLEWRRFATGLFQPLGLKIVNGLVYVTCRDGLIRLHDQNGDGEADFYESFNNDVTITPAYHEFCLGLETDRAGNFYFNKGGNLGEATVPHHGTLNRVSKDGARLDVVGTGLRAPNGLSIGPADEITTSDNEGNWVPASRVNLMTPGGFFGHVFTAHRTPKPTTYDGPLFWLPKIADNSSGGQAWVTSERWGPFTGDLLHMSYGLSSLFKAFYETVDGVTQGGAIKFPLKFDSGVMRGRFSPGDGQMYTCGLVVWQSNGAQKGAFHRVRYTGKPVALARDVAVKAGAVEVRFTAPLDRASVEDVANWSVERWNYRWTEQYGSAEYSVMDPNRKGHDTMTVRSVTLSADGRSARVELPDLAPVMQQRVKFAVKSAAGQPIEQELWHTIHRVPGAEKR